MKRFLGLVLSLCFVFFSVSNIAFAAEDDVVKVGCYNLEGSLYMDENGKVSGYYYDYLKSIAAYTGFKYEFVEADWNTCLEMLKTGEIDLMVNLSETPDRKEYIDYSFTNIGYDSVTAFSNPKNPLIGKKDLVLGVVEGSIGLNLIEKNMQETGRKVKVIQFDRSINLREALAKCEVDIAITNTFCSNMAIFQPEYESKDYFVYIGVKKGDEKLLDKVNYGIRCVRKYKPARRSFMGEYYDAERLLSTGEITAEEGVYLEKIDKVNFYAVIPNEAAKSRSGRMLTDLYERTSKLLAKTLNKDFSFTVVNSLEDLSEKLNPEEINITFADDSTEAFLSGKNVLYSDRLYTIDNYMVTPKDRKGFGTNEETKIAVVNNGIRDNKYFLNKYVEKNRQGRTSFIFYNSPKECMDAVIEEECDRALVQKFIADNNRKNYYNSKLNFEDIKLGENIRLMTGREDYLLTSILNKLIYYIGEVRLNELVKNDASVRSEPMTMVEYIYEYTGLLVCVLALAAGIAVVYAKLLKIKHKKEDDEKSLEAVREECERLYSQLDDSRFKLSLYSESGGYGIVSFDVEAKKIIYCNDIFSEFTGLAVGDSYEKESFSFHCYSITENAMDSHGNLVTDNIIEKRISFKIRFKKDSDEEERYAQFSGKCKQSGNRTIINCVVADITEVESLKEHFSDIENLYRTSLKDYGVGFWAYDIEKKVITLSSDKDNYILGDIVPLADIEEHILKDGHIEESSMADFKELCETLEKGADFVNKEILIKQSGDSEYVRWSIKGYIVYGENRKPLRWSGVFMELGPNGETVIKDGEDKKRVFMHTFGNFEMFVDDVPYTFSSARAKELLAYLVDRRGATATTAEIASVMYEDKKYDRNVKSNVQNVIRRLSDELSALGVEEILLKGRNSYAINTDLVDCDYYDFIKNGPEGKYTFMGEYMSNYSWASFTEGVISSIAKGNTP